VIDNQKKKENLEVKKVLYKSPFKRWFRTGICSW